MASLETELVDVMEPRRKKRDAMGFMTRHWRPQKSYRMERPLTPQQLKDEVANSLYMETAIREEAARSGETEAALRARLQQILKEMCLERKMYVTRALGIAFIKTALSMRVGVHVNERRIFQLKGEIGDNPVLFLPTHRSYADFCLMTYLCYHYDIELPAVAAGMDFYHMAGMGRVMRDTCAFYIPRSLAGARLHAQALRRYVRALLTHNPAPLEFFLEGARSRSNKSLAPKYGLLSMALLPLFTREVPDITVVPINISYDRLVEQTLFAYEHLGVPKPKESMQGLLKTLSFLNDDFGSMYVSVGAPLSAKRLLGELPGGEVSREPLELQELTREQFALVQTLAEHVVAKQQECTVISAYNLVATALMQSLAAGSTLGRDQLVQEVEWLADVLRTLGAQVMTGDDLKGGVDRALTVHRASVRWDRRERLRLVCPPPSPMHHHNSLKLKGHRLDEGTMRTAVPVIQLQLYVNPAAAHLAPASFLVAALPRDGAPLTFDELREGYKNLRSLHKYEFVYCANLEDELMNKALQFCVERDVIRREPAGGFARGADARLHRLLDDLLRPSVDTSLAIIAVVKEHGACEQRQLLRLTQQTVEASGDRHAYCLSLEAIRNLAQGLQHFGALALTTTTAQDSETKETHYSACAERLAAAERALLAAAAPAARNALAANPVLLLETLSLL